MPSKPTHRWKQLPVCWPIARSILTFLTRSSWLWWMWVKRLIFSPVRWELAVSKLLEFGRHRHLVGQGCGVHVRARMPDGWLHFRFSPP